MVVGQQAGFDHPLAEELAHLGFEHTAAQRQLAAWRRPCEPLVGRDALIVGARRQGRTDVVAAHHDHFLQFVLLAKRFGALGLCP